MGSIRHVIIRALVDGIGTFESTPTPYGLNALNTLSERLESNKLEALTFGLKSGGMITIPKHWIDKSLILIFDVTPAPEEKEGETDMVPGNWKDYHALSCDPGNCDVGCPSERFRKTGKWLLPGEKHYKIESLEITEATKIGS